MTKRMMMTTMKTEAGDAINDEWEMLTTTTTTTTPTIIR